jgi:anti-sigma factor RsiW
MSCPERLRTQAFIDGEVAGPEAATAERHIEACDDCQAFCADTAAISDAVRTSASRHAAPSELRRRVRTMLQSQAAPRPDRRSFWRGTVGGAAVTGLAAGLVFMAIQPPGALTVADQVTAAHTRALANGKVIEVASSDHHTVKPWFAGRIDLSPPVSDFAAQGFKLVGGRLDQVAGAPAAVVVYQHGRHMIDLFVWADRRSSLPAQAVRHGYHEIFWKTGDLDFAAVSDAAPPELAKFAELVRSEPE